MNYNAKINRIYFVMVWFVGVFSYRSSAQSKNSSPNYMIEPFLRPTLGVFLPFGSCSPQNYEKYFWQEC